MRFLMAGVAFLPWLLYWLLFSQLEPDPVVHAPAPLLLPVIQGDLKKVASLIDAGADVNGRSGWGETALHWAAAMGRQEIARLLLAAGADAGATTCKGKTPRDFGADRGKADLVELPLVAGKRVPYEGPECYDFWVVGMKTLSDRHGLRLGYKTWAKVDRSRYDLLLLPSVLLIGFALLARDRVLLLLGLALPILMWAVLLIKIANLNS